jgi:hypothetical protein
VPPSPQYAQGAHDAATQAVQHAQGAHVAAGTAGHWSTNAQQDATFAANAAAAASASAASADRAAAATEGIHAMARANADSVQEFLQSVSDRIAAVHEYRVRLDMAEQIAREEAEQKRLRLNVELANGIITAAQCLDEINNPFQKFDDCKRAVGGVSEFVKSGINAYNEAARDALLAAARCSAGDQGACLLLRNSQDKLTLLYKEIAGGVVEGAKGVLQGLETLGDCILNPYSWDSCKQILDGLAYTAQNPYTLIHLE